MIPSCPSCSFTLIYVSSCPSPTSLTPTILRCPIRQGTAPRLCVKVGGALLMLANCWGWMIRCQISIQRWKCVVKPLERG
ncbi:hypothetical protein BDV38DRAFT_241662 [Aspergillus pseudotamarii]|uniref:Uncharacterized protein n=1 Tax=Aspergillus pseudotamarii TaxID=132259 RepID=A0A5N6SZZ3_ASPPS|nr:uncharacterized protein BDV38DRAFT_241662 [Aspergillus pseudotamarii]KAE8139527.1 hypothetical protein BDV38DRAFT_241662 [Aspergillus pseudotamarii]